MYMTLQKLSSTKFSEYYLLFISLLSGYDVPFSFSYFSIGLAIVIAIQIALNSQIFGAILTVLFVLLNLYMIGALLSEFGEFNIVNGAAWKLLTVGLGFGSVNMFVSLLMYYKYFVFTIHPKKRFNTSNFEGLS